jgi:large subunit ribosomal protein L25
MAEILNVQVRKSRGKREARKMRRAGTIPGILYGHGEESVSLTIPADAVATAMRHGARVIELAGAVSEKAFIRETQWDTYGMHVLHVDFVRVSEHERISLAVQVELRGQAPGVKEGGIIEQLVHEVEIECEALSIPEKLGLNINDLKLGEHKTAGDIQLPAGITLLTDAEAVVVHCVEPVAEEELAPTEVGGAEPEVIGRKAEEGEAEE